MKEHYKHIPVMPKEVISNLNISPDGIYIDGTFGCGGHSRLILSQLGEKGRLLAFDCDHQAIDIANTIDDLRFSSMHGTFSQIMKYVSKHKLLGKISGILLDLGVSSLQLDNADRGFSFMRDGPLDMRMNQEYGKPVSEWLQTANESDISWVIRTFGEERFNKRIAHAIINRNLVKPITRTKELVEVIFSAIPIKDKHKHPATRTFQALRIWTNNELWEIESVLKSSLNMLSPSGRLSVITFHSLEDRIVKRFIRKHSHTQQIPSNLTITEAQLSLLAKPKLRSIGKLMPSKEEIMENKRARSAILRVAERTDAR